MTELKLSTAAGDATGPIEKVAPKLVADERKAPVVADLPQADGDSTAARAGEKPGEKV